MAETSNFTMATKRQAILVLGMHRSGTSAVGGVINMLGATAPKTLLAPRADNPRGFFESLPLTVAHDALLASLDSCWDDWKPFTRQVSPDISDRHREVMKAVLIDEFKVAPLIFIKDPRICRFVPFTLSVLAELDISPVAILPLRNPLEVAYSLKRRNDFSLSKSLLLWLRHVLDAEYHSRQLTRYFISYQSLLTDWRSAMGRASETLGIVWPVSFDPSGPKIDQFLTVDLYHERASHEDAHINPSIASLIRETHDILTAIAAGGENKDLLDRLDLLRARFDKDVEVLSLASERDSLAAVQISLIAERNSLAAAQNHLIAERQRLQNAIASHA
jgi:hypothetical protein